jgi:hypothetical protein
MAALLIRTFKETVESGIAAEDIDGINDEKLEKLQEYLQETIRIVSKRTAASEDHTQDSSVFRSSSLSSQVNESLFFTPRSPMTISPPIPPTVEVAPARQGVESSTQNQATINAATARHINLATKSGSKPSQDIHLGTCTVWKRNPFWL